MELGRCRRLVPLVALAAMGVAVLGGPPLLAAGSGAWDPPPCPVGGASPGPAGDPGTWYTLDPSLDRTGTLASMRLSLGSAGAATRALDLAPESFASGPTGGRVIAGSDDGARSLLLAIDPVGACATEIGREREAVVRSAIAAADGRLLYEHRVDRVTRADLGVWMRPLADWRSAGVARRVLEPLPADERYGPVFTTELRVATDGSLLVSSCGLRLCQVRALDPAGHITTTGPTGPALGLADGRLVTWEACAGLPCPVLAHERDGSHSMLTPAAWAASLGGANGDILVVADEDGLEAVDVGDTRRSRLDRPSGGGAPVAGGSLATSGASSSAGEVVLAPHGRVLDPSRVARLVPALSGVLP